MTERLFTADGGQVTDPVLFLSLSAGVDPGQTPEDPEAEPPTKPAKLKNSPLMVNLTQSVAHPYEATYTRTFKNVGERPMILRFPTTLEPQQLDATPGESGWLGDDHTTWSWSYLSAGGPQPPNNMPPNPSGTGPSGMFNTVTLSADEEISVDYNLSGRSVKYIEVPDTNAIVAPGEALPTITTAAPADRNYVQHVVTVDRLDGEPTTLTLKFEANYV